MPVRDSTERVSHMIGALLIKHGVNTEMSANIESRDPARLTSDYTDDVVITFPGQDPIVGREAANAWYGKVFDRIADEKVTVKEVALAHPYAVGPRNTVLTEVEVTQTRKDGVTVTGPMVYAMDFEGAKIKAVRFYVGHPAFMENPA